MKLKLNWIFIVLVVFAVSSVTHAAIITWTNTSGGNWNLANNWSPNQVPAATDTAQITTSGTYTVTNNTSASLNVLILGGTAGTQTLLLSGGNFILGSTSTGNTQGVLNISGGSLGGAGSLALAGPMNWSGGTISNLVQFTGGAFSNSMSLNGGQVINSGTLNWTATSISGGNGSLISNAPAGTINLTANLTEGSFGGTRTFANAGQLNVAVSGTANIGDTFNNTGTVTLNGGTLDFSGGGTGSGSFTAASGATLDFGGGTFSINNGASISGAGNFTVAGATIATGVPLNLTGTWTFSSGTTTLSNTIVSGNAVIVSGGTVNFDGTGPWQPGTLQISNGTLGGNGSVTVLNAGGMTWSGGNITTNLVQFTGGAFSNSMSLNGGQVINSGTLNWTATSISGGNGSLISNAPAGTINLTANLTEGSFGGTRTFANAGQLNVAVSGTANIGDTFNNTGTVTLNGGTLDFSGGGTGSGSFTAASGATLDFGGGTFSINNGASISGAGNFTVAGATIATGVPLNLTGTWTFSSGTTTLSNTIVSGNAVIVSGGTVNFDGTGPWQPGTLQISNGTLGGNGSVTVLNAGGMTWSGGNITTNLVQFTGGAFSNSMSLNGGQVINSGTLNWTATSISGGNGSLISNAPAGTINLTANLTEGSFGGTRTFANAGQLNVAVSGTANIGDTFNNTGTVTLNDGILDLSGSHTLSGTLTFGINALNNYGSNTLAGAAGLAGTLKSAFNGGYLPSVGNTYNIMTYGSSSGNFIATNLSPLAIWQVNQGSTALSITVLKLVPQVSWATPADIVYGAPLSGSQLNATATWNGTNVPGVFNYSPLSGTVLDSGSNQMLSVTFTPSDPSTYTSVSTNVTINVQKAPLGITANSTNKTYGQNFSFAGTEFTTSGLTNGDTVTSASLASAGAISNAPVSGSPYAITITNALGDAGLTNYNITYINGTLTVNPAGLAVTANNTNKTYGAANPAFSASYSGFVNNENSSVVSGSPNFNTPATVTSGMGGYAITPSLGTLSAANYSFGPFNNGTLTINPAALSITASNLSKTYGQTLRFAGTEFSPNGLLNGDTVASVTLTSAGAISNAPVSGSPYSIVPSAATGTDLTNYSITYTNGTLTVNKAMLTITADSTNKIAGENWIFAGTEFTASGLQNGETIGTVTLTSAGAASSAPLGPYSIVPSAPVGGTFSQGNYSDQFVNGTLSVLGTPDLTLTILGDQYVLTFTSVSGQIYQLQSTTNLAVPDWSSLGGTINGTGGTVNVTNTVVVPQSFFQLQIAP